MKVSYKKIKRIVKSPRIIDHYYGLTMDDFLTEEQIKEQDQLHIRHVILRGRKGRESK